MGNDLFWLLVLRDEPYGINQEAEKGECWAQVHASFPSLN